MIFTAFTDSDYIVSDRHTNKQKNKNIGTPATEMFKKSFLCGTDIAIGCWQLAIGRSPTKTGSCFCLKGKKCVILWRRHMFV